MKHILENKNYKISGKAVIMLNTLLDMYHSPYLIYRDDKVEFIPLPTEQRDFLIGKIAQMFDETEWEKV